MSRINPQFLDEVRQSGPFNATACMNCGTCTALCPIGLEELPREMFRYVVLGLEDKVLDKVETIFTCLLCKLCESNCPGGVHIVENVRTLRHHINKTVHKL
ncbi:MAG TPA: 4Fe-4S dicluster domain-containing protein [Candidatus Hydrogenedentes bacterium]|nr:4Fe-4S dicluster domain-containing protein [Candidatus Hydrogenedentota bacterium]